MNGTLACQGTEYREASRQILQALEVVHNPATSNDSRRLASDFLNLQRDEDGAYRVGFMLAEKRENPAIVRHFGLSLVEHVVCRKWHDLSDEQNAQIRSWICILANDLASADPPYVRNKVAHIWVELAKKSWGLEWLDMDSALLDLWSRDPLHKDLVLSVLENLYEDTFTREDTAAVLRGQELNTALVEIFTPLDQFAGGIKVGGASISLRANHQGWLSRIVDFVHECVSNLDSESRKSMFLLQKALAVLRSVFAQIMLSAVVSTHCVPAVCSALFVRDTDVLMVAIQALQALYNRSTFEEAEFMALVYPMYQEENVKELHRLFEWSVVGVEEADSPKYAISKKLSDMISLLVDHIQPQTSLVAESVDLWPFTQLLIEVAGHASSLVSMPILFAMKALLASPRLNRVPAIQSLSSQLLEIACGRIYRYDQFPDDSTAPAILFATDDFEDITERDRFLGEFRQVCVRVVDLICCIHPNQAIPYVLAQTDASLDEIARTQTIFDPANYTKLSPSALQVDAKMSSAEAALKGGRSVILAIAKRHTTALDENGTSPTNGSAGDADLNLHTSKSIEEEIVNWAGRLMARPSFRDPVINQRVIRTAAELSRTILDSKQSFALQVMERILADQLPDMPQYPQYSEAVRELQVLSTAELRRLATRHANYFATFYPQLEIKIQEIVSSHSLDERAHAEFSSTLLTIMLRADQVDPSLRQDRLLSHVRPLTDAWQDSKLTERLHNIHKYTRSMALDRVIQFLRSQKAAALKDWSSLALAPEGELVRIEVEDRYAQLPLRFTKNLLGTSLDKAAKNSQPYRLAHELWTPILPSMLPKILQLLSFSHQLHDPSQWPDLPSDMSGVAARILQDRFWQSGVSDGSMKQFYETVLATKASLEGFASSIRGTLRKVRETCCNILYSCSMLGDAFYGIEGFAEALGKALFTTAGLLSLHTFSGLLDLANHFVEDCPLALRPSFLPGFLSILLHQIDRKTSAEWASLDRRKSSSSIGENLAGEMKEESMLRELCYKSFRIVAMWLNPLRDHAQPSASKKTRYNASPAIVAAESTNSLRTFLLSDITILEPLLLLSAHGLLFPDTRTHALVLETMRGLVPHFAHGDDPTAAAVREYMSSEVLKATITSLNDSYFVDLQSNIAALIATIWVVYGLPTHIPGLATKAAHERPPLTQTVRNVILSLPGLGEGPVDAIAEKLHSTGGNHRKQKALVLELLHGLRGVRISELGKLERDEGREKRKIQEKYMKREGMGMTGVEEGKQGVNIDGEGLDELGGVANLFG